MKKLLLALIFFTLVFACDRGKKESPASLVNPFIGTDGHGHTYPGAALPFGMVQLSPDTRKDSWDGCSGYHYSDSVILGFSHTHLSGTGVGDYGDVRFMPLSSEPVFSSGAEWYASGFSHDTEKAYPGYYQVHLDDHRIDVQLTVGDRAGFHKYIFPGKDSAFLAIDLGESVTSDRILGAGIYLIDNNTIAGFRTTDGWADEQHVYFYAVFSRPVKKFVTRCDGIISAESTLAEGEYIQAYVEFEEDGTRELLAKVGISGVDTAGARRNLQSSLEGRDFNEVKEAAWELWDRELSKIEVEGGRADDRVTFYTALYHAFLAPNLFSDADGRYRGHDKQIHSLKNEDQYTVFSLWDTYRAAHPLYNIIQPDKNQAFIRSMLRIYKDGGLLPVWELAGNETFCMIGYHAVPVITDAFIKGYRKFDAETAMKAMLHSASIDHFGLHEYRKYGYIPADMEGESVSKTLEYAYDDWCIATMAEAVGKEDIYFEYIQRAQYYKNLYDPSTGFIRGKKNGMFVDPFDPREVNFMLTEANTWQYTFYVPHDISGLMDLMGGKEAFNNRLDEMFSSGNELTGRNQADITGLIGQYAHGNEPSHHMAYLYNYCGKPHKTQRLVRQIMRDLYSDKPDGLCGNEDCGQMSAWYVFSAMGFYPVTPGTSDYAIGSPLFDKVTMHFENGRSFSVNTIKNNDDNVYIQSAELNGEAYTRSYLTHATLMQGGEIQLLMGSRPNDQWGTGAGNEPITLIKEHLITEVPYFLAESATFKDFLEIRAGHVNPEAEIRYSSTSGRNVSKSSELFPDSLLIGTSSVFNIRAFVDGCAPSKKVSAEFYQIPHNYSLRIRYPYNSQYTAGGDMALIDMQRGGDNFRTGGWQGYHGVDLEVVIDLGKSRKISSIAATFLEDQKSWIFFPEEVVIEISKRPYDFKTVAIIRNRFPERSEKSSIQEFSRSNLRTSARYVRVKAKNIGICPEWHIGAGNKAWIFVDEISIK